MNGFSMAAAINTIMSARWEHRAHHRYVNLFRDLMESEALTLRAVALKSGLSKSRVGLLLHADAEKRREMYLHEYHRLLSAFDLDEMEAIVLVNTYQNMAMARHARFRALLNLLSSLFTELPPALLRRIELISGFDGTEVHRYWKDHLMNFVIDKLADGVCEIVARRENPFEIDRDLAARLGTISQRNQP